MDLRAVIAVKMWQDRACRLLNSFSKRRKWTIFCWQRVTVASHFNWSLIYQPIFQLRCNAFALRCIGRGMIARQQQSPECLNIATQNR